MSVVLAAGLGCRAGCALEQVLDVLQQALTAEGRTLAELQALHTVDFKQSEPALQLAAELLQKPLVGFSLEQLRKCSAGAHTQSAHTLQRFGVPSIAETAALAGAASLPQARGPARLLAARSSTGSATCALAEVSVAEPPL
ncbi:MAG: hypothetical protein RL685_3696 [Pseudomonadota bacterium]